MSLGVNLIEMHSLIENRKALETRIRKLLAETERKERRKTNSASQTRNRTILDYANTHRDIVEQCQSGNRQAQFELYRLYSKAMYNVCLRMVRDEWEAEDLLQNSFIDVFTKLHTFRFQSSVGAWIKRIVVNNCINFLKKKKVHFEELEERFSPTETPDLPKADAGNGLNLETVRRALYELPDGYRVVFSLYMLEGYDHKEIAGILGISEATSKSQYSRAKSKLRDIIESQKQVSNF